MYNAAGTLVFNESKILAFQRTGKNTYSLPCGKIEPGETSAEAAIRETFEETGLLVELFGQPFIGTEVTKNCLVSTYQAKIIGGKMYDKAEEEGKPVWIHLTDLVEGPFWNYNERLLRHFGYGYAIPTRRVWVIGPTKSGKTTFGKRLAAQLQMPLIEAGSFSRSMTAPGASVELLTEFSQSVLAENPRFFSERLSEKLNGHDAVIAGVRNPVDFLDSFDPRKDYVIFLKGEEPKTEFEVKGIKAIHSAIEFFEANGMLNSNLAEQIITLSPDKSTEDWFDASRFKAWITCQGEWQLLGC